MYIVFILQKGSKHAAVLQFSQGEYEFEKVHSPLCALLKLMRH